MSLFEVIDESGLRRLPVKELSGERARRHRVDAPKEPSDPAEVRGRILESDRCHGDIEVPSDHFGDRSSRHALVADGMQHGSRRRLVQRESEQMRGIETMHGRPPVRALAYVGRDTALSRDLDERRYEAPVSSSVDARR